MIKKRLNYIDIAKAIGIMCVIIGHTVSSDTESKRIIYAFHMPLFFMLSGMLTKPIDQQSHNNLKSYVIKKLRMLMLPYAIWGLVYASFSFKHLAQIAYGTRETLMLAESLTSLWFLPVTFLSVIISDTILCLPYRRPGFKWTILPLSALFLVIGFLIPHHSKYGNPLGCDIAVVTVGLMLLGHMIRQAAERIKKIGVTIVIAAVSLGVFVICVRFSTSNFGYVLMANAAYGNPFWFFINGFSGSIFVIAFSWLIEKIPVRKNLLLLIGQRTLGIFVIHKPIVELGRKAFTRIGMDYNHPVTAIAISLGALCASMLAVLIIERILPEAIGLKRRKDNNCEKD